MRVSDFKKTVWAHYRKHRRDFPWRNTKDPYQILVSEIMLQQTQAPRVIGFYDRFLKKFPTASVLANAPLSTVLSLWRGLGYNRRALMLKRATKTISDSGMPRTRKELEELPGVGPATAGAVLAYAFQVSTPFIETNIRRTFIHEFFPRRKNVSDEEILPLVEKSLKNVNPREWYYALMDYG